MEPESNNPFLNRTVKLTTAQKFRYAFPGAVLLPLRVGCFVAAIGTAYASCFIATAGVSRRALTEKALTGWRSQVVRTSVPLCIRLLLHGVGFHRVEVVGKAASKAEAPIIVCNHIGPWEPAALFMLHRASFITSSANFKTPFIGSCLYATQQVRVDRHDKESRAAVQAEITRRAKDPLWPQVGIFPEGTCTNGTALIGFRTGAFTPGLPIQPVVVTYPGIYPDIDPSWVGFDVSVGTVAMRLMARWSNTIKFEYLPVHVPTEAEKKDPELFASNVRKSMAKALNVQMTRHSMEDLMLQNHAKKLKVDPKSVVVGMDYVRSVLHFSSKDVQQAIEAFAEMDRRHTGTIRYLQFVESVGLADSELMREAWHILSGKQSLEDPMNFHDFLQAVAKIADSEMGSAQQLIHNFEVMDLNHDNCLQFNELYDVIKIASPQCTTQQVKALMKRIESSPHGANCVDVIEFSAFMRENPLIMLLLDISLKRKEAQNPKTPAAPTFTHFTPEVKKTKE